jgi:large subunit ribosomal protein L13
VEPTKPLIIDGEDLILGRLASYVAKEALEGKTVIIVNAEKVIISGSKKTVLQDVKRKMGTRTLGALKKSPIHYRRPDTYLRRVIRGMLPWKRARGKEAYRRIRVYMSIPSELTDEKFFKPKIASLMVKGPWIRVEDVAQEIGGVTSK